MHAIGQAENTLNRRVVESSEMLGKECISCGRILEYNFFRRDHTFKDGRRDQCQGCESSPKLSTEEHVYRLREMNYHSHAVQRQRWEHQEDYENAVARVGRPMHHSDFIRKLKKLVPSLYFIDGRIIGDLAVWNTYGRVQEHGLDSRYLFFMPSGILPEFSQYEFDSRDVPVKESRRGWRTVLLRLIIMGLLTEEACNREFGRASGVASAVWNWKLYLHRNRK